MKADGLEQRWLPDGSLLEPIRKHHRRFTGTLRKLKSSTLCQVEEYYAMEKKFGKSVMVIASGGCPSMRHNRPWLQPFVARASAGLAIVMTLIACATNTQNMSKTNNELVVAGPLAKLVWLSGSWSSIEDNKLSEKHWTTPSSNLMLGMNRTVVSGVTKHHEQLRIEATSDGIFYVANPARQATTSFKLVDIGESFAVFENPQHDYPKRITYRRTNLTLTVRIEGLCAPKKQTQ